MHWAADVGQLAALRALIELRGNPSLLANVYLFFCTVFSRTCTRTIQMISPFSVCYLSFLCLYVRLNSKLTIEGFWVQFLHKS
jgi:hypothetical protein